MDPAFWDTSAIIPLCVKRQASDRILELAGRYKLVVWWATSVEARSTFSRLLRMREIAIAELSEADVRLNNLKSGWEEVRPFDEIRDKAEWFLDRFPLRAADALQLAAAYTWALQRPHNLPFISGDRRLLGAAQQLGFQTIET